MIVNYVQPYFLSVHFHNLIVSAKTFKKQKFVK